jgi:uncharacterized protein YvpB
MRGGRLVRALAVAVAFLAPWMTVLTGPASGALAAGTESALSTRIASYTAVEPLAPEQPVHDAVWVPNYFQQRNLSCEYASAVIAMAAYGVWVSEWEFDGIVGSSTNPHWGYRGDINGVWGNTDDYGVYAEALVPALNAFGFWGDAFYAAGDSSALTARLDAGSPTLVWIGLWGNTGYYEYTEDGTPFKLVPGLHVVVAYDYDEWGVWVSDPATGTSRFYDWGSFMWMWNAVDGMGLAVGPY